MINYTTPIETYNVNGKDIDVKRDELQGDGHILPPWAKLTAIERILQSGELDKTVPIIQLSVRASFSGWALAKLGTENGYDVKIAYPNSKNFPQKNIEKWKQFPVEVVPLRPNMTDVVLGQMKRYAAEKQYQFVPYGFEHPIYIEYWEKTLTTYDYDTLVVCAGTPVTCLGMVRGFRGKEIHLVATSTENTVRRRLAKYNIDDDRIRIHTTPFDFYDEMEELDIPFDCNQYWDAKVWWWIENNVDKLKGRVLFWNLGGKMKHN